MSLLLMLTSDYEFTVPQGETQKLLSVRGYLELLERREALVNAYLHGVHYYLPETLRE